jgi:hypothetical protein
MQSESVPAFSNRRTDGRSPQNHYNSSRDFRARRGAIGTAGSPSATGNRPATGKLCAIRIGRGNLGEVFEREYARSDSVATPSKAVLPGNDSAHVAR